MDGKNLQKSLHMADFGLRAKLRSIILVYTWFDCRENHYSNAAKLTKNNLGIIVPVIYVASKHYILQNIRRKITMTLFCFQKV